MAVKQQAIKKYDAGRDQRKRIKKYWQLLLLVSIPTGLVIVLNYAAYPGLRMVFMDYKPVKGYSGSEWVGWGIFEKVFRDKDFYRALRNSIVFNVLGLLVSFPAPILLAFAVQQIQEGVPDRSLPAPLPVLAYHSKCGLCNVSPYNRYGKCNAEECRAD